LISAHYLVSNIPLAVTLVLAYFISSVLNDSTCSMHEPCWRMSKRISASIFTSTSAFCRQCI